jgi:hypothetical protein
MSTPITALWAGPLALLFVALSYQVVRMRHRFKQGLGDGGHPPLQRAIRVHGNFAEYVPFILLLLALCELTGAPAWALHTFGATALTARLLHAWGVSGKSGTSIGRYWGTLGTFILLAFGGGWALWLGIAQLCA